MIVSGRSRIAHLGILGILAMLRQIIAEDRVCGFSSWICQMLAQPSRALLTSKLDGTQI